MPSGFTASQEEGTERRGDWRGIQKGLQRELQEGCKEGTSGDNWKGYRGQELQGEL